MSIPRATLLQGLLLAATGSAMILANADFREPPRYDGAGYAVLARSILSGRGYREIDQPNAPLHSHFPPGYPLAMAGLWRITGISVPAAHALSFTCTLGSMLLAWVWFRSWTRPSVALLMALALAVNWRWAKEGATIRSEPLFCLLGMACVLLSGWVGRNGGRWSAAILGGLLGCVVLTRHVGLALAAAVLLDLWLRGRRREALVSFALFTLTIARWCAWLFEVPGHTQVGLIPVGGLRETISGNGLFYLRRSIDQIIGPVIEVATVYASRFTTAEFDLRAISILFTAAAAIPFALMLRGWFRLVRRRRSRLAGLIPGFTLAMLLAWPFTEAGRFLVPLVPFLVAGLVEGLAAIIAMRKPRRARRLASILVLAISLPYSLYSVVTQRASAERATHRDFDSACAWIAAHPEPPGPVLCRHPGEVYLQTGRFGVTHPTDLGMPMSARDLPYILHDGERFMNAGRLVITNDERPSVDWYEVAGRWGSVVVYRARTTKTD